MNETVNGSPQLRSIDGKYLFNLDQPLMILGRDAGCEIIIDSNRISRHHCALAVMRDFRVFARDLNSTNGTRHNDRFVDSFELKDGDILRIADLNLVFVWPIDLVQRETGERTLLPAGELLTKAVPIIAVSKDHVEIADVPDHFVVKKTK